MSFFQRFLGGGKGLPELLDAYGEARTEKDSKRITSKILNRRRALSELVEILEQDDVPVFRRLFAIEFIGKLGPAGLPALELLVTYINQGIEQKACSAALAKMGSAAAGPLLDALQRMYDDEDKQKTAADGTARMYVRQAISGIGDSVIPEVMKRLNSTEMTSPFAAGMRTMFRGLSSGTGFSSTAVYEALAPWASAPGDAVRSDVIEALNYHAEKLPYESRERFLPVLLKYLDDPIELNRSSAGFAIGKLRAYGAKDALIASAGKYGMNVGLQSAMNVLHIEYSDLPPSEIVLVYTLDRERKCFIINEPRYQLSLESKTREGLGVAIREGIGKRFGNNVRMRVILKDSVMGGTSAILSIG